MALAGFISKIVQSITRTTFQFNKTLDVLIDRFKEGCPTTKELESLVQQKNQINGALNQINQKIATLNKVAQGSEVAVEALKAGKTVIKQLPIPSSVPPGVGLPLSVTNNLADSLDNLGTLIDKEEASLESIPEALELISNDVGEVITKLNEFDVVLNDCIEKDPNITSDNLNATTFELEGVLSEAELEELLNTPPGLLYGDYYLRLSFPPTDTSLIKKQIIAQNKESVIDGDFYNENEPVEELLGDESFSSSNVVLVDEMKWLIDTKDLIFPPPEPQEDPLKAIYRENQIIILMSLFGANREEAGELYELAWELSQNRGPNKGYYDTLVQEAFDNSRSILEQAVANEGYEWQQGDRILDATIKKLFLADFNDNQTQFEVGIIRRKAEDLLEKADNIGGDYNETSKRWNNDGNFESASDNKLYPLSERLALTAENLFNDETLGEFVSLRDEMAKRKPFMQAIFEIVNERFLAGVDYNFNDPLNEYFTRKGFGYNQPIINGIIIQGNSSTPVTSDEIFHIYEIEKDLAATSHFENDNPPSYKDIKSYSKYQVFLKLKNVLGMGWYNKNAEEAALLPFWTTINFNPAQPGYQLFPEDQWYFEFGRNGLPIPTGS